MKTLRVKITSSAAFCHSGRKRKEVGGRAELEENLAMTSKSRRMSESLKAATGKC